MLRRKPQPDPDPGIAAMQGKIRHARRMAGLHWDCWEARAVPRTVALEARIALGELLLADCPVKDAKLRHQYMDGLEKLHGQLDEARALEAQPGPERERWEAYTEAKERFDRAYAEYHQLVEEGRVLGVVEE
jgi:hypothetical protein